MKPVPTLLAIAVITLGAARASSAAPGVSLRYDTGPAYIAQNDGRYGDGGTRFGAATVGQQDNLVRVARTSLELTLGNHTLIALYAPFDVTTRVTLDRDLRFRDAVFAAGTVVDHRYLFDGYRASYLYQLTRGTLALGVGGSLQVRNADVAFTAVGGGLQADQDDIGLVAAAKARLRYQPSTGPWAELETDALSTFGLLRNVSGGIYDVGLTVGHRVRPGVELTATARLLGGGAAVPEQDIVNWANFVSATIGLRVDLSTVR